MLSLYERGNTGERMFLGDVRAISVDKVESNYTSNLSTIKAGNDINLTAKENILNEEANILANKDININASTLYNKNFAKDIETNINWNGKIYTTVYEEGHDYQGSNDNHSGSGGGGKIRTVLVANLDYSKLLLKN